MVIHAPVVKIIQSLMHDKNSVIDHHTDQDDKPKHGQDVHGLRHKKDIEQLQTDEATGTR